MHVNIDSRATKVFVPFGSRSQAKILPMPRTDLASVRDKAIGLGVFRNLRGEDKVEGK